VVLRTRNLFCYIRTKLSYYLRGVNNQVDGFYFLGKQILDILAGYARDILGLVGLYVLQKSARLSSVRSLGAVEYFFI
jgi:hypothetical protein